MTHRNSGSKSPVHSRLTEEAVLRKPGVKAAIDKLTKLGARRDQLMPLVLTIPGASAKVEPLVATITERRLRELPDRIKELSEEIKRINGSQFLTPRRLQDHLGSHPDDYPELLSRATSPEWAEIFSSSFLLIPDLLNLYAEYLRVSRGIYYPKKRGRKGIPRSLFRLQRLLILRLLRLVRDSTGGPHHSEVATILQAAYQISGKTKNLDADILSKLEQNAGPELRLIVHFLAVP
jgi:hypothetical protein